MEEVYLSINMTNIFSILIICLAGWAFFHFGMALYHRASGGSNAGA